MTMMVNSGRFGSVPDSYFGNTVLLLSCDGANGSTTFTDESSKLRGSASSVDGNAAVSTTNPKFGTGCLALDGTGDRIVFLDSIDFTWSTSLTIEVWARFNAGGIGVSRQVMLAHYNTTGNGRSWHFSYLGDTVGTPLVFTLSPDGSTTQTPLSFNWTPTADQWYHLCVERDATNKFRLYIDGVMQASATNSSVFFNTSSNLRIGNIFSGSETQYFNGALDEIRLTKGVSRYASDSGFAVPTAAYPRF